MPVPLEEIQRVLGLLERMNALLHQPLRYRDPEVVDRFARENYPELRALYYHVVPGWLPEEQRRHVDER